MHLKEHPAVLVLTASSSAFAVGVFLNSGGHLSALGGVTFALATSCFASFAWGIRRFFLKPERIGPGVFFVKHVGTAFALLHLTLLMAAIPQGGACNLVALPIYAASLALYWSALSTNRAQPLSFAYANDMPVRLVRTGPYWLIRHPFYSAYILAWIAGPVALGNAWLALTSIVMAATYLGSAMSEEQRFERSPLAAEYRAYKKATGMLVPRLWRGRNIGPMADFK